MLFTSFYNALVCTPPSASVSKDARLSAPYKCCC